MIQMLEKRRRIKTKARWGVNKSIEEKRDEWCMRKSNDLHPFISEHRGIATEAMEIGYTEGYALGLEQANEKIKSLEAKLSIAVDALEFYADRNGEQDWPQDAIQALEKLRGVV